MQIDRSQGGITVRADRADAAAILSLQRLAYQSEADLYGISDIPPLTQTLKQIEADFEKVTFLKVVVEKEILIGSVRAYRDNADTVHIGRLIVHSKPS